MGSHRVTIRPAAPADAAALVRLAEALNRHEGEPTENFTEKVVLRDGFGAGRVFDALLAETADGPVGYAIFVDFYDTAFAEKGLYLADLFVAEAQRGQGIGRALVAAVAAEARRRGTSFVFWTAMERNRRAQAFYRSLGATEEPLVAYALNGAALDRLAGEAAPPGSGKDLPID
jgi:GNAT superfamily N-acetyltransferase